jgi:hypothetical protein
MAQHDSEMRAAVESRAHKGRAQGNVLDRRNACRRVDEDPQGQDDNHNFEEVDPDSMAGTAVAGTAVST